MAKVAKVAEEVVVVISRAMLRRKVCSRVASPLVTPHCRVPWLRLPLPVKLSVETLLVVSGARKVLIVLTRPRVLSGIRRPRRVAVVVVASLVWRVPGLQGLRTSNLVARMTFIR